MDIYYQLSSAYFNYLNKKLCNGNTTGVADQSGHGGGSNGASSSDNSATDPSDSNVQKDKDSEKKEFEEDTVKIEIEEVREGFVSKIKVANNSSESGVRHLENLIDTTLRNHSNSRLIAPVWDYAKDKLDSIIIRGDGMPVSTKSKIWCPHDRLNDQRAFCEEVFHIYQRSMSPGWPLGNVELEAKIYDCLLLCQVNKGDEEKARDFLGNDYYAFMDFYNNPGEDTYKKVVSALRRIQDGAYSDPVKYRVAELGEGSIVNYSDMLKHIRGIRKAENKH